MIRTIAIGLSALLFSAATPAFQQVTGFGQVKPNPGNLSMYIHVPAELADPAPVVLALHGCQQTAQNYHEQSGWSELADQYGFIVVYPQQNTENQSARTGNNYKCFNWAGYYGELLAKGQGENQSLKEMVDFVLESYDADDSRVFITGLSAGGAMTNLMLATWPELFAGGAPMAGVPALCARTVDEAYACMGVTSAFQPRSGCSGEPGEACMDPARKRSPQGWGDLVRQQNSNFAGRYPRVIIWQGDKDQYVDDDNAIEILEQWTNLHGTDLSPELDDRLKPDNSGHRYRAYESGGETVVALVDVREMKHGIAVDPGTGEDQGGRAIDSLFTGGYSFDKNIHSSYYTARFWGLLDDQPGRNENPQVSFDSPAEGARLSGQVEFRVSASDDQGIASVDFYLDGNTQPYLRDTTAPYTLSLDVDGLGDGGHSVRAVATDSSPEAKTGAASLNFTVGSVTPVNEAPTVSFVAPTAGSQLRGEVGFRVSASDDQGIASVDFYIDGSSQPHRRVTVAPYELRLNVDTLGAGNHSIRAVVTDTSAQALTGEASLAFSVVQQPTVQCRQWTTYNYLHAFAGRAVNRSLLWWRPDYRVVGSDESLGSSSYATSTVRSTAVEGEYAKGTCP